MLFPSFIAKFFATKKKKTFANTIQALAWKFASNTGNENIIDPDQYGL